jgi:hypothetical protein
MADTAQEYRDLGLDPDSVAAWEDGLRTDTAAGSYEWWYFDAHLDDGSSLVIVFYTKNPLTPDRPLEPFVAVHLDRPDAETLSFESHRPASEFSASTDGCDVRIGDNSFRGNLKIYQIHVAHQDLIIDVALTGGVPPWRPATGHLLFGERGKHQFAWLPSVPQGTMALTLTANGQREELTGIGYHDHNWGDVAMHKLINHWYWGRAQAGPYSIIASYITAEHRYGDAEIPVFLLAKGTEIVADDATKVRFSLSGEHTDEQSGKPVGDVVIYEYTDGDDLYRVSFRRAETIANRQLIDEVSGLKHLLARLSHFDGSYLRFTGQVRLEHIAANHRIEDVSDAGIWELMYFGHTLNRPGPFQALSVDSPLTQVPA